MPHNLVMSEKGSSEKDRRTHRPEKKAEGRIQTHTENSQRQKCK